MSNKLKQTCIEKYTSHCCSDNKEMHRRLLSPLEVVLHTRAGIPVVTVASISVQFTLDIIANSSHDDTALSIYHRIPHEFSAEFLVDGYTSKMTIEDLNYKLKLIKSQASELNYELKRDMHRLYRTWLVGFCSR